MDHAVYRDDISHVIIDNLQFMTPRSSDSYNHNNSLYNRLENQDILIDKFRKFASDKNVI